MRSDEIHELENEERLKDFAQRFVGSRNEKLTNWVTSFLPGQLAWRLASPSTKGDYRGNNNWGVRVIFSDEESWIVRFAREGLVVAPDEKVECEVAAMQLIRQHTDIPVPDVKAWGLSRDKPLGLGPFIKSSFVEGKDLGDILQDAEATRRSMSDNVADSTLDKIYRQIVRFQSQLASLNFSHIGNISATSQLENVSKTTKVDKRPLTWRGHEILLAGGIDVLGKCSHGHEAEID
jgi:hypothetical protein